MIFLVRNIGVWHDEIRYLGVLCDLIERRRYVDLIHSSNLYCWAVMVPRRGRLKFYSHRYVIGNSKLECTASEDDRAQTHYSSQREAGPGLTWRHCRADTELLRRWALIPPIGGKRFRRSYERGGANSAISGSVERSVCGSCSNAEMIVVPGETRSSKRGNERDARPWIFIRMM